MQQTITLNTRVQVSDPCLDPGSFEAVLVKDCLPGKWIVSVRRKDCGPAWGTRIASLTIRHEDYPKGFPKEFVGRCCVDSGQCGFFDEAYYDANQTNEGFDDPSSWYHRVCQLALSDAEYGVIDDKGAVSASGYGDGVYGCYAKRNKDGFIVALTLKFIS